MPFDLRELLVASALWELRFIIQHSRQDMESSQLSSRPYFFFYVNLYIGVVKKMCVILNPTASGPHYAHTSPLGRRAHLLPLWLVLEPREVGEFPGDEVADQVPTVNQHLG